MPGERRGQATCVLTGLVNWQQKEPLARDGGRQSSLGGTSRMNREVQVRICERLGVQFPGRLGVMSNPDPYSNSALSPSAVPSTRTGCRANNKRNTSPKINSSTRSAIANEKTIPAPTAIAVITSCITFLL